MVFIIRFKYELLCEECLKSYVFPASDANNRAQWFYRTQGAFTLPDYAKGGYAAALALRFFNSVIGSFSDSDITWATGIEQVQKGGNIELADFCLWYQRKRMLNHNHKPKLVWGEAKSFAAESFKQKNITNMRKLAEKFPSSILVFATMKEQLSKKEIKLLTALAMWGRKYDRNIGETRAPVVILTGTELFSCHHLQRTWKEKGGTHAKLIEHPSVRLDNLKVLANLTQQLYLNMPSYHVTMQEEWKKKKAARDKRKAKAA